MLKRIALLVLIASLIIGCGTKTEQNTPAATEITVAQAIGQPDQFVDKAVKLEGTVVHVCKHGGKRMFITGENPEERLKITVGGDIGAFDVALEGSVVEIEGVMKEQRIDAAYLDQREADIASGETSEKEEFEHKGEEHTTEYADHSAEHSHQQEQADVSEDDHHSKETELKQLQAMRKQLEESGKDHLSFYSVECTKFTEK